MYRILSRSQYMPLQKAHISLLIASGTALIFVGIQPMLTAWQTQY